MPLQGRPREARWAALPDLQVSVCTLGEGRLWLKAEGRGEMVEGERRVGAGPLRRLWDACLRRLHRAACGKAMHDEGLVVPYVARARCDGLASRRGAGLRQALDIRSTRHPRHMRSSCRAPCGT